MAVTAREIFERARRTLFDMTGVRWTDNELLEYVNDAQAQIVLYRPDANAVTETIVLDSGSRQSLAGKTSKPPIRLLRVIRNAKEVSLNNLVPGNAVRESSRLALDSELPTWHVHAPGSPNREVSHFTSDLFDPLGFYVYPAVNRVIASGYSTTNFNVRLELVYAAVPSELKVAGVWDSTGSTFVGATADDLEAHGIGDHYAPTILDWVMYRAYSKDTNYAGNFGRAVAHLQAFSSSLGVSVRNSLRASIPSGADRTLMNAPREVP